MTEPERPPAGKPRQIPAPERREERLSALLIVGLALLNFPLLSIFNIRGFVFGIPVLYFYLFSVWLLIAGFTALVLRRRPPGPRQAEEREDAADT